MSRPAIQSVKLNQHPTPPVGHTDSECRTNNCYYFGVRAKTSDEACEEAIEFWAARVLEAELAYAARKVDEFVGKFTAPEDK